MMVFLELKAKPNLVGRLKERLAEWLPATRAYEGCNGTAAYALADDSQVVVMIEQWTSEGHYERYRQWRADTGVRAELVSMLDRPPSVRFFQQIQA